MERINEIIFIVLSVICFILLVVGGLAIKIIGNIFGLALGCSLFGIDLFGFIGMV